MCSQIFFRTPKGWLSKYAVNLVKEEVGSAGRVTQVVERLPGNREALSSNPSVAKVGQNNLDCKVDDLA
jgi:hypothetical protein